MSKVPIWTPKWKTSCPANSEKFPPPLKSNHQVRMQETHKRLPELPRPKQIAPMIRGHRWFRPSEINSTKLRGFLANRGSMPEKLKKFRSTQPGLTQIYPPATVISSKVFNRPKSRQGSSLGSHLARLQKDHPSMTNSWFFNRILSSLNQVSEANLDTIETDPIQRQRTREFTPALTRITRTVDLPTVAPRWRNPQKEWRCQFLSWLINLNSTKIISGPHSSSSRE